ncbi:SusC/RagA family TonB-linked outer membrane protein [Chitinophaga horti]|uniref:SusC/RagA family TonB-linked outer membrane protein n=1 Tax=Chitinophaga horti TaxID=2920382 RepID=A0ABY6IX49_9BACT|nr:SusC/RagA family TonB-linked outer membrane protein [Chitinophaga horti]UYQ91771.1 SusC/RagA family TonB-linked outer membrane protein [Chitinophaga horti]
MENSTLQGGASNPFAYDRRLFSTRIIMRIQIIFIMMFVIAMHSFGNANAQFVSISVKKEPLTKVFDLLERQSGYYFTYKVQTVEGMMVSADLKQVRIQDALDVILKGLPLEYRISEKTILIVRKVQGNGQVVSVEVEEKIPPVTITGTITTADGVPFPGVTVRVKGTNNGTVTDKDGRYSIVAERGAVLVFSYVGYKANEIAVTAGQTEISFALLENPNQLKETVVKGYYSTTKELNTGAVNTLKANDISKQPVSDPLMTLQGRVPGLYINQTSGVPGAGLKVNLRGRNSMANGNEPLYIVDGIPFNSSRQNQNPNAADFSNNGLSPFQSIRPEDIESIDILKDADATAIYGSRGANGVIIITTKKGKSGKTQVDVNLSSGIGKVTRTLDLLNTEQYLAMRMEAFKNDGINPGATAYDVNGRWDKNRFTDWQKEMIGGTARITNVSTTLSGGNKQTQFLLGSSYRRESTVYPGNYANRIASANLNINHTSESQKFRADVSANYANNNNRLPTTELNIFSTLAPNTPNLYKPNGELNFENGTFDNPLRLLKQKSTAVTDNLISNIVLSYNLTSSLQLKSNLGYSTSTVKETNISPLNSFNPFTVNPATDRTLILGNSQRVSWIVEPQINYSYALGSHVVDATIGTSFQNSTQEGIKQTGTGFSNDLLLEDISAAPSIYNETNSSTYRYTALYARLAYNFQEKYVLNLTGRRDGSSRFGPNKQFGNFGAVGIGWIFSKEQFITSRLPYISFGKIRGSVGTTGNDQLADYAYLNQYLANPSVYLGGTTLYPLGLTNPFFGWETINKIEAGIDLGFLNDKIMFNVSVYRNRTKNQLVGYSLPFVTGFNTITGNLPATIENRGVELEASSSNIKNESFSWTTNFNISFPKNKLVSYPNIEGSSYNQVFVVGKPLNVQFVYKFKGINPTTGIFTFDDLNKDGLITSDKDRYAIVVGQKFYGGINNTFAYKGITLDCFVQFVKQNGFNADVNSSPGMFTAGGRNQPVGVLDHWRSVTNSGRYQKYSTLFTTVYRASQTYNNSDAKITDASFVRLKNIQVSWTTPLDLQQRWRVPAIRLYLQAQNLITITNYNGTDPEIPQYQLVTALPPLKILIAGIQIKL